jgi:SAM-dependent methyltransferase
MMFPYALTSAATAAVILLLSSYPVDAFRPRSRNRQGIRRCSHSGKLLFHLRCGDSDDIIDEKDNAEEEDGETKSRKMYNKQASNWVRTEPSCLSDFTGRPVVFSMLEDVLKGGDDKVVLDVGCGEGYCARKVVEMGAARVVGSDISKEMITCALDVSNGDDRFKYYEAVAGNLLGGLNDNRDYLEIDSAEEAFDVAMAVFLFNYLTTNEMEEVIRQIYTTLKPGGTFVFSVPHPSMIFCHHKGAIFRLNSENKGYYSSRNQKITGTIAKIDGTTLNIMSVHKTLADYMKAIFSTGFEIVDIQEAGVTEEHMKLHPEFFQSVKDRPLHLVFKLQKPN